MLAEVLILNPISNGNRVACLELPSAEGDDSTIQCGYVEVPSRFTTPVNKVDVYLSSAFSRELEIDGDITSDAIRAEEDFVIQAVMIELPRILAVPLAQRIAFTLSTPQGRRILRLSSSHDT